MFKAFISLSIAIAIPAVLISGCSEREAARAAVKGALHKQAEMNAFAFAGGADLHLDGLPAGDSSTVPGQLFSFLKDSKLEWKGAASLNPVRWESDLKAASRSGSAELTVPLLFQDNKLFFHMPLLNPDNEYFVTRLGLPPDSPASAGDKTGTVPKTAASPTLEHLSRLYSDLSKLLQEGADEAWFEHDGEVKLTDGSAAQSYTASVTRMNAGAWNKKVQEKLPRFLEALKSNGLISEAQAAEFGRSASSFKLSALVNGRSLSIRKVFYESSIWNLSLPAPEGINLPHRPRLSLSSSLSMPLTKHRNFGSRCPGKPSLSMKFSRVLAEPANNRACCLLSACGR
ncbi:hypothetical protein [Paenibacillus sp. GbtcB18]|uniref:hypothetical protein n=1 Tax=Paenibacillus sp. GbtcB18 TaxID=2824763 RepID=UPI0020C6FFC6|nr:hypothetical protein [Paenibacillus sp. GbtcB18]